MKRNSSRIIVTAGPTREPIDPVRFISNRSTGVMGYKIAEEALRRGNKVTLISGPVKMTPPKAHKFISIETAEELLSVLKKEIKKADCLVMCAAVSDFRPKFVFDRKIKKSGKELTIDLVENKDILQELSKFHNHKLFIGFSLETENLLRHTYSKLKRKNLDLIVANSLTKLHNPFDDKNLNVFIIDKFKNFTSLKGKNKAFISYVLLDKIEELWYLMKRH